MDPRNATARAQPSGSETTDPEAVEFVRFCYRRRRVGWPELYDEMCAVAGRGLYHGFAADDLGEIGIGFSLDRMPALATIVQQVVAEDTERRRLTSQAIRSSYAAQSQPEAAPAASDAATDVVPVREPRPIEPSPADPGPADVAARLVALAVGA
jgi:hypothetical protein